MKLSKSILSPVRATRDFSFLSRRLRSNGSRRGGLASPFGKKRGCAIESHEPSSPKVTCIGQVRVKSKRKARAKAAAAAAAKQCRSRSLSRRADLGEASFRRTATDQSRRNQRWVHLPISICEALRGFGADYLCCIFHGGCGYGGCGGCGCGCSKRKWCCGNGIRGCGAAAAFGRWLLCLSVSDGREREVVVGDAAGAAAEAAEEGRGGYRRHVFEDMEVRDGRIRVRSEFECLVEEEPARVSICIPPKNALLLMRCRSDPMKMAALANRISSAASKCRDDDPIEEELEMEMEMEKEKESPGQEIQEEEEMMDHQGKMILRNLPASEQVSTFNQEPEPEPDLEMEVGDHDHDHDNENDHYREEVKEQEEGEGEEEEVESNMSSFEALLEQETTEEHYPEEDCCPVEVEAEAEAGEDIPIRHSSSNEHQEELMANSNSPDAKEDQPNPPQIQPVEVVQAVDKETSNQDHLNQEEEEEDDESNPPAPVLPDCLLLMMCEPKLSMEVSKETWVRGTDFIRWLPARKPAKPATKAGCCHHDAVNVNVKRKPPPNDYSSATKPISIPIPVPKPKKHDHLQPPRSSCSLPAAASSMATILEQKLQAGGTYEPFVLTRCKSEPMRTAAAKLTPESLFCKNSSLKMEPHPVGVGAAGIS
ncbi:uncharacterized protein LOC127240087 [Andrographis paniculata]|uniref:uncharacterized protein LOC127240087 n=1 Tax=Andrographis paniculata TaxID=175694 RepID=UPI0021E77F84|nr:uncharacterized protein LOC127240087 [Andrographis paniculata]